MNARTKLSVTTVLEGVVISGVGWIATFDEHLFLVNRASGFSLLIPLEGSTFEVSDPTKFWLPGLG